MATARKYVFFFGKGKAEGRAEQKNLLGGKGANLHEMTRLGIPVPSGFTISTEACIYYTKNKKQYPAGTWKQVEENLKKVEQAMGAKFGDPGNPLLVSVRSGARVSMPGMMDTVLNLGLNDQTLQGLIARSKNERFAYDSYRRFIQMFGDVVLGIEQAGLRAAAGGPEARQEGEAGHRAYRRRPEGAGRALQARGEGQDREGLPPGSQGAAPAGHQRRVRILGQPPGRHLPEAAQHPGGLGDGGQRPDHGLRQHGRQLGDGRGLHPRPGHRRAAGSSAST